jgi:tetratricopeptide (TPR) repeat protein
MTGADAPASDEGVIERLLALPDPRAAAAYADRHPDLHRREVVETLADEVARLVHVDVDRAERLAEAARSVAERLGDDFCRARAERALGHVRLGRSDSVGAVAHYERALAAFDRLGDRTEAGRTLSSSVAPLVYLGRYDEVRAAVARARAIFDATGDRLRLARLDTNLASLLYRQDRFQEALDLYLTARAILAEVGQPHDIAVALRNLAVCYISLNRFDDALATHEEARRHCETHGLSRLVVEADYNIAYLHYLRGEYTKALELYQAARVRAEHLDDDYHRALCDLDQSELYLELNLVEEGAALAEEAYRGFEALGRRYEAAKALTNLAVGVGRRGEAVRALQLFARAREMFVAEGNAFWPPLLDAYRALVLEQEGRHYEARQLAEGALRFFEAEGQPSKAALCELILARIHLRSAQLVSARRRCVAALDRLGRAESPDLTYRAYLLLGQVEEALGFRRAALEAYRAAYDRLENLRSHLEQDQLKIGFLKDKLAVYESLVTMALADGDDALAFTYMEQAKSRSLADLLAFRASVLPGASGVRSSFVEQVHGLRQELNWYYRSVDLTEVGREPRSPEQMEALRGEIRSRETELLRLLRERSGADAEFASLQAGGSPDLDAIRSTLPRDATLVEYYEARGSVLAAVLTHRDLTVVPLTPSSRVRHLLQLLQFQLAKFGLGPEYVRSHEAALREAGLAHLRQLHADLVEPIRGLLRTPRLIVVPHDVLHYLPFHALGEGPRALVDDFVVSYAPSAGVHHLCCGKRPRGQESLVLGVPDPATPHIEDEVKAVAAALPGARVFLGPDASEAALREHGPRSRFIHVATHGRFRHDNPMFSSVQLGTSRLSLFDLYQLDLPAELVTLSGCGTGLNVAEGGDELLGLVRGLLYAGTRSALVSLWDVSDVGTAEFMAGFYQHLGNLGDKGLALQRAMWDAREARAHPYYWAPFVLVGRGA